jgi:hypothetical protein
MVELSTDFFCKLNDTSGFVTEMFSSSNHAVYCISLGCRDDSSRVCAELHEIGSSRSYQYSPWGSVID